METRETRGGEAASSGSIELTSLSGTPSPDRLTNGPHSDVKFDPVNSEEEKSKLPPLDKRAVWSLILQHLSRCVVSHCEQISSKADLTLSQHLGRS